MANLSEVFELVQDFLDGRRTRTALQDWIASRLGPIVEAEHTPAGELALTAQHLGFVLSDGEIDEAEFRSELRQALEDARRAGVAGS